MLLREISSGFPMSLKDLCGAKGRDVKFVSGLARLILFVPRSQDCTVSYAKFY